MPILEMVRIISGSEGIVEREEMGKSAGAKVFFCGIRDREGTVFSITKET